MHINEHEKALQWAEDVLASNIVIHQIVVETPWSVVYKIETPQYSLTPQNKVVYK
jgi:hypothetical protein